MIATLVQDDLVEELKTIFRNMTFPDPRGDLVPLNIYKQDLPIPVAAEMPFTVSDEDLEEGVYDARPEETPFPYIIVRVGKGHIADANGEQRVDVDLLIGVIDRDYKNQGHKEVLNIIQKIYERFAKNVILAKKYECVAPMDWALQEEGSYPYFFGGMALTFETIAIRREDPYI